MLHFTALRRESGRCRWSLRDTVPFTTLRWMSGDGDSVMTKRRGPWLLPTAPLRDLHRCYLLLLVDRWIEGPFNRGPA